MDLFNKKLVAQLKEANRLLKEENRALKAETEILSNRCFDIPQAIYVNEKSAVSYVASAPLHDCPIEIAKNEIAHKFAKLFLDNNLIEYQVEDDLRRREHILRARMWIVRK